MMKFIAFGRLADQFQNIAFLARITWVTWTFEFTHGGPQ
jgi:hypothetical protein